MEIPTWDYASELEDGKRNPLEEIVYQWAWADDFEGNGRFCEDLQKLVDWLLAQNQNLPNVEV